MLKRPKTQQLQKESILAVEVIVNKMNCEFRRLEPDNAGIDGEIDLVKTFAFEGKSLKTQIKAGTSYISSENEDSIRIKVEKKYVELWKQMNVPVILFFYHPDTKNIYWKSVQDYLRCDPKILKKDTENVIIPFDKNSDFFSTDAQNSLRLVVNGQFEYTRIIYAQDRKEEILSNWFPVISLPDKVYIAPTSHSDIRGIINQVEGHYGFILKSKSLYTFSDLTKDECELRRFCDCNNKQLIISRPEEIEEVHYIELLNKSLIIFGQKNDMSTGKERFYFLLSVLGDQSKSKFEFRPLKRGKDSSRSKIYIRKSGNTIEYQHMAVKLAFIRFHLNWYFQIEPDWYFSYPPDSYKTIKEIGIRITREKANMYNETYLYLLHAWKQFLSNSTDTIIFPCDDSPDCQKVVIDASNKSFISDFMLLNDYFGPKMV